MKQSYILYYNEIMKRDRKVAVSLFSSAGIGELGLKACDIDILVSNEILKNRHELYAENYPNTSCITGDIWDKKDQILEEYYSKTKQNPFLLYATPPCQGMSSNGAGKILNSIRNGNRKSEDPRNRLIIPTMYIAKKLKPEWLLLENVPTMFNTIIRDENNNYINIIDYIKNELGPEYVGKAEVVNCADYGIPQIRKRLITIFTRTQVGKEYFEKYKTFLPPKTHSEKCSNNLKKWVTLKEAIGQFPELQAKEGLNENKNFNPWHIVPIMKQEKYWWVENTKEGDTAFNNQCVNPKCLYQNNFSFIDKSGQTKRQNLSIYCEKCGSLLPRPTIVDKNTHKRRIIKGFKSAYKRMEWNNPAPTLTQNMQFEASDNKIHPTQNRVLSVYEGLVLQTISQYDYKFEIAGETITRSQCCEIIGESVPPYIIEIICKNIQKISD